MRTVDYLIIYKDKLYSLYEIEQDSIVNVIFKKVGDLVKEDKVCLNLENHIMTTHDNPKVLDYIDSGYSKAITVETNHEIYKIIINYRYE